MNTQELKEYIDSKQFQQDMQVFEENGEATQKLKEASSVFRAGYDALLGALNISLYYGPFVSDEIINSGGSYHTPEIEKLLAAYFEADFSTLTVTARAAAIQDFTVNYVVKNNINIQSIIETVERKERPILADEEKQQIYNFLLEFLKKDNADNTPTPEKNDTNIPLFPLAMLRSKDTLMATSKVFNKQLEISSHGKQGIPVNVASDGKPPVLVNAAIFVDEEHGVAYIGDKKPTFFDIIVTNALGAIYRQSGPDKAITAPQVWRELAGITESNGTVHEKQAAMVELSFERLRTVRAVIDFTEQAKKHTKLGINADKAILEDYLISASRVFSASGGHIVTSYLLKDEPLFFKYSKEISQVTTINKELLNHEYKGDGGKRETLKRSELTISINHWLIMQIEMMKSQQSRGHAYEPTRTYNTFFERTETSKPARKTEMARIRAHFNFFLEKFKRQGYIADYETSRTGREITGFKIMLPPRQIKS